jgi:hypothetical protein
MKKHIQQSKNIQSNQRIYIKRKKLMEWGPELGRSSENLSAERERMVSGGLGWRL